MNPNSTPPQRTDTSRGGTPAASHTEKWTGRGPWTRGLVVAGGAHPVPDAKQLRAARKGDGTRLYSDATIDELVSRRDLLPKLLPGPENIGKSDTAPDTWIASHYEGADERAAFVKANALPASLPHGLDDFLGFFDARGLLLKARIKGKLTTRLLTGAPSAGIGTESDIDVELGERDLDD